MKGSRSPSSTAAIAASSCRCHRVRRGRAYRAGQHSCESGCQRPLHPWHRSVFRCHPSASVPRWHTGEFSAFSRRYRSSCAGFVRYDFPPARSWANGSSGHRIASCSDAGRRDHRYRTSAFRCRRLDLDLDIVIEFGQHIHGSKGSLPRITGPKRTDADEAMTPISLCR